MYVPNLTKEEIERNYKSALDSVNLINAGKPVDMSDAEWGDTLMRNKIYLHHMIAQKYWTTENLDPLIQAAGDSPPAPIINGRPLMPPST